jgi:MFS family permease
MPQRIERWYLSYMAVGFAVPGLAAILVPLVVVDAGHRPFRIGAVIAMQNWGILLAPVWGWAADRLAAHRFLFVAGLIAISLGFAGFSAETRLSLLLLSSLLVGIGTGICSTVATLLITEFQPPTDWGMRLGWLQLFAAAGTMVGLSVAGRVDVREGMTLAAVLMLVSVPVAIQRQPAAKAMACRQTRPPLQPAIDSRRELGVFGLFLASRVLFSLAVSTYASLYPIMMAHLFGVSVRLSSMTVGIATFVSLPFYAASGRLMRLCNTARLLVGGMLIRCTALAGLTVLGVWHLAPIIPVLGLAGLFQAIWPLIGVASSDLAATLRPGREGMAVGSFNAAGALASGCGALLSGLVADMFGYRHVCELASGAAFAALACTSVLNHMIVARANFPRAGGSDST